LGDGVYDVEHRIILPNGAVRWVRIKSQTYFEGATSSRRAVRTVGALLDVTAAKQAEEEREQLIAREHELRSAAEAANRMKDEFLSTLSHELRTPLTSIVGWTGLLRERDFDAGTINRGLETIERSAKAQQRLIEDILDVSRIISGSFRLLTLPLQLGPIVESAIETISPAAQAKNISLQSELDRDVAVSGDSDRLLQVAWNLLSNAIKFTPQRGSVNVRLRRADHNAELSVQDNGQGIDPDLVPYVFERFWQADSTSARKHAGLGLGLAITRHIVELHGGSICATSSGPNRGTTFTVTLPLLTDHN